MRATKDAISKDTSGELNYQNMFFLFMMANVGGVILEGFWTLYKFGRWETHVVTMWGPFCLLYGIGAVTFYLGSYLVGKKNLLIQFLAFAVIADIVEYICAWMIEDGLNLRAWTYKKHFMNLQGRISFEMTIIWGVIGVLFSKFLYVRINCMFQKMKSRFWKAACIVLTVFMIVNMSATVLCMIRWSQRHKGNQATNRLEQFIDERYDDSYMHKKFCEWWFIDEEDEFWQVYKKR